MTKKIFHKDTRSMSVTVQGKYPTHSVVGVPSDFYVYISDKGANSWSEWILRKKIEETFEVSFDNRTQKL